MEETQQRVRTDGENGRTPIPNYPPRAAPTQGTEGAGGHGPLYFRTRRALDRHRKKREEEPRKVSAMKERLQRVENEKWRIATLNVNGLSTEARLQHLKSEMRERQKDIALSLIHI